MHDTAGVLQGVDGLQTAHPCWNASRLQEPDGGLLVCESPAAAQL